MADEARRNAALREAFQQLPARCQELIGLLIADPPSSYAEISDKLGIPVVADRAMQATVASALEPEWEARFEGISYGFRPGRGCHDAIVRIFDVVRPPNKRVWVVDADIEGALDNVDHDALLEAIGAFAARGLVRQWLKAGYVEFGDWHPTGAGTPQGGVVSPLLANIALSVLDEFFAEQWVAMGTSQQRRQRRARGPRCAASNRRPPHTRRSSRRCAPSRRRRPRDRGAD